MSRDMDDLEATLCRAYRAEADHYQRALELAETLPAAFDCGQSEQEMRRLQQILDEIGGIEHDIRDKREAWHSAGRRPGPALQDALNTLRTLLEELIPLIQVAETRAQQAREQLMPEVDLQSRTRKMREAYGRGQG